ncbi:O-antigen ligase family protein [Salsuginibacillus kocurii]|uniref:O-antigen ligase family protein n=1 Tax=Salsuginibacillus kocurii TaxID=427078 RepID=UPI00037A22AC|nr:O-antigen ligase family protein [Salsuginibacillus kocurii]
MNIKKKDVCTWLIALIISFLFLFRGVLPSYFSDIGLTLIFLIILSLKLRHIVLSKYHLLIIGLICGLIIVNVVNVFYAEQLSLSLISISYYFAGVIIIIIIRSIFNTHKKFSILIYTFVSLVSIVALINNFTYIMNLANGYSNLTLSEGATLRSVGFYGNPNNYAILLNLAIGILLGYIVLSFNKLQSNKRLFTIYNLLLLNMVTSLFLTLSRGAWLAFFFMTVIATLLIINTSLKKAKVNTSFVIFTVGFFIILLFVRGINDLTEYFSEQFSMRVGHAIESGGSGRLNIWSESPYYIFDNVINFLIGIGGNQFIHVSNMNHVHNHYLKILIENGVIGFTILIFMLGILVYLTLKREALTKKPCLFIPLVGFLVSSFTNDHLIVKEFFFLVALILNQECLGGKNHH